VKKNPYRRRVWKRANRDPRHQDIIGVILGITSLILSFKGRREMLKGTLEA
jgi:hypothetical protein